MCHANADDVFIFMFFFFFHSSFIQYFHDYNAICFTDRYPAYMRMIPQGNFPGASQGNNSGNEAGPSGSTAAPPRANTSAQCYQMPAYGCIPLAGFILQQQTQGAQVTSTYGDSERQTGPNTRNTTPPSVLQIQLSQIEQYIEVLIFS